MSKRATKTTKMSELLKEALREAESLRGVARESGVSLPSIVRFLQGTRTLRLDIAEKLAEHFEIESRHKWQED